MSFISGDCVEIFCTHLGVSYRYSPKANETFNIDKGGVRTNDDKNQVTANGRGMYQKNNSRWMVDGTIAVDQLSGAELGSLNLMAASPSEGVWQFYMISGAIYQGTGMPVGDLSTDGNAGTLSLKVSGGGILLEV